MSDSAALQVIILRDGLLVGTEAFVPGTFLLGSSAESDLKLDDPTIAGQHAILFFQNGRAAIQQSEGAVLVNGHPVRACEVRPVDEIAIGPFTLKVRMLAKRAQAPKPAPAPELAQLLGARPPAGNAPPAPANVRPQAPAARPQGPAARPQPQPGAAPMPAAQPQAAVRPQAVAAPAPGAHPQAAARPQPAGAPVPGARPQPVAARPQAPAQPQPAPRPPQAEVHAAVTRPVPPAARPQSLHPVPPPAVAPAPVNPPAMAAAAPPPPARPTPNPMAQTQVARHRAPTPAAIPAVGPQLGLSANAALAASALADASLGPDEETRPGFRPAPSVAANAAVTLPSARRVGNAVVEPLPRSDSLAELQIDSGPFRAPAALQAKPSRSTFKVPNAEGRGKPRLYLELFWGESQQASHCFRPAKKPLTVGGKDEAFALHGFAVPEEGFTLAEADGDRFRVFAPPDCKVERLRADGSFSAARGNELARGAHANVSLALGEAVQFVRGPMTLRAYVANPPERYFGNPFKNVPWLATFFLLLTGGALLQFALKAPRDGDLPDFNPQDLAPVAVRLLKPQKPQKKKIEKPKPEKEKPAKETPKVAEEKPKPRPIARAQPKPQPKVEQPPAPEVKALKALEKLSAAGPAMHDMLAAVDKLGNGPGSKHAKSVSYKLSGLVGKAPIASAGLGTFGLGGGGKGGIGTLGAELLHGKGGGGIGAMGAGGIGHGKIAGSVSHAVARNVAAQGNIDREAVARAVNQHLQEVRACYERQLLKDPGLAGKVVLEWTISTSGRVVQARTKTSTLNNASVESCILASLKTWQFPAARGGLVIVSYPFLFNAVGY